MPLASKLPSDLIDTLCPVTLIVPPLSPDERPFASSLPSTTTEPSNPASRTISPFWLEALRAWTKPLTLMVPAAVFAATRAVTSTRPPSAISCPVLSFIMPRSTDPAPMLLPVATPDAVGTRKEISLSPENDIVSACPDPRATVPKFAWISPLFSTRLPAKTA